MVTDTADQLTRLADLRDRGILTDAEFNAQKSQLLASGVTTAASAAPSTPGAAAGQPSAASRVVQRGGRALAWYLGLFVGLGILVILIAMVLHFGFGR